MANSNSTTNSQRLNLSANPEKIAKTPALPKRTAWEKQKQQEDYELSVIKQQNEERNKQLYNRIREGGPIISYVEPAGAPVRPEFGRDERFAKGTQTVWDELAVSAQESEAKAKKEQEAMERKQLKEAQDFRVQNPPKATQEITDDADTSIKVMMDGGNFLSQTRNEIQMMTYKFPQKDTVAGLDSVKDPATIIILDDKNMIQMQTNKFLLTSLTKTHQERFQVMETFGESTVLFFDARTKMYTLQGLLYDSDTFVTKDTSKAASEAEQKSRNSIYEKKAARYQWAQAFQTFYTQHLRATQLKNKNFKAAIYVNNSIIKGYPVQLTLGKESSSMPDMISFAMTWVIESDFLLKADTVKFMYDGGVTIATEFRTALANFETSVTKYNDLKDAYVRATNLKDVKRIGEEMNKAGTEMLGTQKVLKTIMASKNNKLYDVDKNY